MTRDDLNKELQADSLFIRNGMTFKVESVRPFNKDHIFVVKYRKATDGTRKHRPRYIDLTTFCYKYEPIL